MKKPAKPDASPFKHAQADDSPGFLLWKLNALWQQKLGDVFATFSITQTQYAILASLLWFEQQHTPPTQAHLCAHARIDKMTLSKAIRKLEESGLLCRESSEIDTRAMEVRFTAAGRTLVRKAIVAVEQADDAFFSCLTPRELQDWKTRVKAIIAGSRK